MRVRENFNKKLLVEGNDDQHVVWALCEKFNVSENFDVIDCEGIDKLIEQVPVRFKQSDLNTLGIVIDADTDIKNRWASLHVLLTKQEFTVPEELPLYGLVLEGDVNMKVGIWIMPNNDLNGMLEDFLAFLVPSEDKLLSVVNSTLTEIESQKLNRYSLVHKSKAKIHTWLSWQEDPGTPMGLAITKRYLTTDKEVCINFINWLKRLYS